MQIYSVSLRCPQPQSDLCTSTSIHTIPIRLRVHSDLLSSSDALSFSQVQSDSSRHTGEGKRKNPSGKQTKGEPATPRPEQMNDSARFHRQNKPTPGCLTQDSAMSRVSGGSQPETKNETKRTEDVRPISIGSGTSHIPEKRMPLVAHPLQDPAVPCPTGPLRYY